MTGHKLLRRLMLVFSAVALLLGTAGAVAGRAHAQPAGQPHALVITVDGVINPVKDRYIERALEEAVSGGATLLVIRLDTPGGLLDSTRDIVERLLAAPVPTAVTSPRPGRGQARRERLSRRRPISP